jgi:hypothetical protein
MDVILIIIGLVIAALLIRVATLKARMIGYRDAATQILQYQADTNAKNSNIGCSSILAVVGFLAICAFIFYLGTTLAIH